jgi:hypothetical protein
MMRWVLLSHYEWKIRKIVFCLHHPFSSVEMPGFRMTRHDVLATRIQRSHIPWTNKLLVHGTYASVEYGGWRGSVLPNTLKGAEKKLLSVTLQMLRVFRLTDPAKLDKIEGIHTHTSIDDETHDCK